MLNCMHVQTFTTHSVLAIMGRVKREDPEHPRCAEGLFIGSVRLYSSLLNSNLQWLLPRGLMQLQLRAYIPDSTQWGNSTAACHTHTSSSSSSAWIHRPVLALREEAAWHDFHWCLPEPDRETCALVHYSTSAEACGFEASEPFNGLFWASEKPILSHAERQSSDWSASGSRGLWRREASALVAGKKQNPKCVLIRRNTWQL